MSKTLTVALIASAFMASSVAFATDNSTTPMTMDQAKVACTEETKNSSDKNAMNACMEAKGFKAEATAASH